MKQYIQNYFKTHCLFFWHNYHHSGYKITFNKNDNVWYFLFKDCKKCQTIENKVFSKKQIDQFVKEDRLPKSLASKVEKRWSDLP